MGENCSKRYIITILSQRQLYWWRTWITQLGLTIKPKPGMMIAFPSYKEFAHKVHPVTSGFRYSLVSWLETEKKIYETIRRERV